MIKIKRAWLLTWEWDGSYAEMEDKIAGIYPSRYSVKRIMEVIDTLYHQSNSCLIELASYVAHPKSKPYNSEADSNDHVYCGKSCNPYLEGRRVSNVVVFTNKDDLETIEWDEEPRFEIRDNVIIPVTTKTRMTYQRTRCGSMSIKRKRK